MLRSAYKLFALTALLFAIVVTRADGGALIVKATSGDRASVAPGQIVTTGWLVANPTDTAYQVREHVTLPADWRLASMDGSSQETLSLPAKQNELRIAALMVPSSAPAGDYTIGCEWTDANQPGVSLASGQLLVNVQRRDRLELTAKQTPLMAIAGETYAVTLVAINRGNSILQIKASARVSPEFPVTLSPAEFSLAPGAMQTISAQVATPADLARSGAISFQGIVTATTGVTAEVNVLTEAYTTKSSGNDAPTWPAVLQTTWINQPNSGSRVQAGLQGSARSDDGSTFLYLLRSAGVKNGGFFNEPEQYSFEYLGRQISWRVGQHGYGLSPLTTRPQFGSGAGISYKGDERWSSGAFAMRSRESATIGNEVGAYTRYLASPELTLTANLLSKEEGTRQTFAGDHSGTVSVEAKYEVGPSLRAKLELGGSLIRPDAATGSPYAQRLEVNGHPGPTTYDIVAENYGSAYFGALSRAQLFTGSVTHSLTSTVDARLEENHRSYANPYSLPGTELVSNKESTHLAGFVWRPLKDLQVMLDAQRADRSFGFTNSPTRYIESTARFGARKSFSQFVVESSIEAGSLEARAGDVRNGTIQRTNTSVDWNPDAHSTISIFISNGNDPYSSVSAHTRTYGASVHTKLTPKLSAALQAGQNLYDAKEAQRRSYFYGELTQQLSHQQSIGVRATWTQRTVQSGGGVALALSYSRAFSLPLPSLSHRAAVEGTLTDSKTGEPLRRVVLMLNGRTAITDRKGHYAFTELNAGSYTLAVDPRSLGSDRLIREKLPLAVHVGRGEKQLIALSAESAGKVYVQIESQKTNGAGAGAAPGAGVVVQLVRAEDHAVLSELTNESGRATFSTVRPGDWKLKVDSAQLPARYRVAKTESILTVAGADTQEITVAVHYEAPAIRWVSSQ